LLRKRVLKKVIVILTMITLILVFWSLAFSVLINNKVTFAGDFLKNTDRDETIMRVSMFPTKNNIEFSTEIIELTNNTGQNYFVNYRIKREQFRQDVKEMLRLLLESDIKETRKEAQERWLGLCTKISREEEIENVLKMRGFPDVVSEVNSEKINITVLTTELTLQQIYFIKKISADITDYSEDKIEVFVRS
jgi:stage III sporulation protein AH